MIRTNRLAENGHILGENAVSRELKNNSSKMSL